MKNKILLVLSVVVMASFLLNGCGTKKSTPDNNSVSISEDVIIPKGEESDKLLEVREKGLNLGYVSQVPSCYYDEDGNFTGSEVEIIAAACKKIGITKINPVKVTWDSYSVEVQQGKIDMFGIGVYVTDERKKVMNLSNISYDLQECMVVRKDSGIKNIEDLKNKTVGSTNGSLYMDVTKNAVKDGMFGKAVTGGAPEDLVLDVQTGKIDAAMMDTCIGSYLTGLDSKTDIEVMDNWENITNGQCCYLFNKSDTEFVKEFNKGLDAIKEDGTMEKILKKYGMEKLFVSVEDGQVSLEE